MKILRGFSTSSWLVFPLTRKPSAPTTKPSEVYAHAIVVHVRELYIATTPCSNRVGIRKSTTNHLTTASPINEFARDTA